MNSYNDYLTKDARLIILRSLAEQNDYRLNEAIIVATLDSFGHRVARDWVRTQLNILADLGAVMVSEAGTVKVAEITRLGLDHVQRRTIIEGVARPSPEA